MKCFAIILTFIAAMLTTPVFADDVTDQINEALKAYKKKDYSVATSALNAASSLIGQKRAEALAKFLPEPLKGWNAEDAESSYTSAAMMGGSVIARRVYTKNNMSIKITITADSPMIQTMGMMFSNPMFSSSQNKLVIIDGRKVVSDKKKRSLQTIVGGKILVNVDGKRKADPEAVKKYFKAIKFSEIEKLAK